MSSASSSYEAITGDFKEPSPLYLFFPNDFSVDDVGNVFRGIQRHSKDIRCTKLSTFLTLCNRAIKDEVATLLQTWQQHVPVVEDVMSLDLNTHFDPTGQVENSTQTPYMNFMENPGLFDAGFFNMSPREALETDPMHRLALVTAYEALEMAGYVPDRTRVSSSVRVGSYYGQASDDWRELNASQNIGTYAVPGGERAFANGRIQYFFKFKGPCFNMDTACSSGLAAVNAACSALWAGDADMVIAGGLNVITDPDNFCQLGKGHFLSNTGQCKVWDESADGYCRADGVGSVIIKRLEDAEADNDNIIAVILSAATNHSADAVSITQPHAPHKC